MDQLLMASQDMTDALKYPHPYVPLATIVDDTITVLTTLAVVFTKKLNKPPVQATTTVSKAAENKHP